MDILGNEVNPEQFKNNELKYITLFVFHLDISGNTDKDLHSPNICANVLTFLVFQLDISGIDVNEEQP